MLEEMLLQKLEEPESEEERMLSGLSKEELIEKVLQAKVRSLTQIAALLAHMY